MRSRQAFFRFFLIFTAFVLGLALFVALSRTLPPRHVPGAPVAQLDNVRDFAPARLADGPAYAVDGGRLMVGQPRPEGTRWEELPLPEGVIAASVDFVPATADRAEVIYVGAANELVVYRTTDRGQTWSRNRLTHPVVHGDLTGSVTDLAVDPVQRLVYAGTDTAGLFRLREAGGQLLRSAQLMLGEPVLQVVVDRRGSGLALVRTRWRLYRATNFGLRWERVDTFGSAPTMVAIAQRVPAVALVGTVDRGVLQSADAVTWTPTNLGLSVAPATRLYVDALAVDPLQPAVVYAAVSYLYGPSSAHHTPTRLAVSRNGGLIWTDLAHADLTSRVAELLPQGGQVYALTLTSRTPVEVGPEMAAAMAAPSSSLPATAQTGATWLAWFVAGFAAMTLGFALSVDLLQRRRTPSPVLAAQPIRRDR